MILAIAVLSTLTILLTGVIWRMWMDSSSRERATRQAWETERTELVQMLQASLGLQPVPAPTKLPPSSMPEQTERTERLLMESQFDDLPQSAKDALLREWQESQSQNGGWVDPNPKVPQIDPGNYPQVQYGPSPTS